MSMYWPPVGTVITLWVPRLPQYHRLAATVVSVPIWWRPHDDEAKPYRCVMVQTEDDHKVYVRYFQIQRLQPPPVREEKGDWSTCCWEPDTKSMNYLRAEMRVRRRGKT